MILAKFLVDTSFAMDQELSNEELGRQLRLMGITAMFGKVPSDKYSAAFGITEMTKKEQDSVLDVAAQHERHERIKKLGRERKAKQRARSRVKSS